MAHTGWSPVQPTTINLTTTLLSINIKYDNRVIAIWRATRFLSIGGWFYLASREAFKSNHTFKIAAIIIRGGAILSVGHNRLVQHPEAYWGCSFHAEFDAIRNANGSLKGSKLLVYRFSREDGSLATSKPCKHCQAEIAKAGISRVIFVDANGEIKKDRFVDTRIPADRSKHKYFGYVDLPL